MNYKKIPELEARFKANPKDAAGQPLILTPQRAHVLGSNSSLYYFAVRPENGREDYFQKQVFKKTKIVLHYTVGYLPGDIQTLMRPKKVSVAFVIGRDGTIYNLFPSKYWAWHLGSGAVGGNTTNSRASIGIEISNIGPLTPSGNNLNTAYGDPYCTIFDKEAYQKTLAPYRDYAYYASFTEAQYDSLRLLLNFLCAKYQIPRKFVPRESRFEAGEAGANWKGVSSHVNFQATGKTDIGPGFDWDAVDVD